MTVIDLRSDTVTTPTAEMRATMAAAEVGDDVYSEDPTINRLQEKVAALLGMEAALFVPSGSMSNQIAVRAHTVPGDELICETTCHIYVWEAGGPAALSGVSTRTATGDYGVLDVAHLRDLVRPKSEHYAQTRLVTLENTHNRGGGRVYPLDKIIPIADWAHSLGLQMHLDGARIWNAHVATGVPFDDLCRPFDSVSVCFSKGLGAPVGSALVGTKAFVAKARRIRKLFGGAMRQAGIIAAAAEYAIDNHIPRLADDHRHAQVIAQAIADTPGLRLDPPYVETNLVWFEVDPALMCTKDLFERLRDQGILLHAGGPTMRACTHLDVSTSQADFVAETIRKVCKSLPATVK